MTVYCRGAAVCRRVVVWCCKTLAPKKKILFLILVPTPDNGNPLSPLSLAGFYHGAAVAVISADNNKDRPVDELGYGLVLEANDRTCHISSGH